MISSVKILRQEVRLLQVVNQNMIQRLSQLEEELETNDENENESDNEDNYVYY